MFSGLTTIGGNVEKKVDTILKILIGMALGMIWTLAIEYFFIVKVWEGVN